MQQGIRISGFGGQGVISAGVLLAYAGMLEGKNVSWFPSYGPEMRGGTANCSVVIADDEVASPVVSCPDTAIVLNEPSFAKFEPLVRPGGLLLINSSLINSKHKRTDIDALYVPANSIAEELGAVKIANIVLLGAYAARAKAVSTKALGEALPKVFKHAAGELLKLNLKALERGAAAAK